MDASPMPDFWLALVEILVIDTLRGGDGAVVIARACRKLSDAPRRQGMLCSTAGTVLPGRTPSVSGTWGALPVLLGGKWPARRQVAAVPGA